MIVLVTTVHAARSATSSDGSRGCSPVDSRAAAAAVSLAYLARVLCSSVVRVSSSDAVGRRDSTRSVAKATRSAGVGAARIACAARTRALSTYCGSFISTSACCGVFVRCRVTMQVRRSEASNAMADGGGAVRFHAVYRLRR